MYGPAALRLTSAAVSSAGTTKRRARVCNRGRHFWMVVISGRPHEKCGETKPYRNLRPDLVAGISRSPGPNVKLHLFCYSSVNTIPPRNITPTIVIIMIMCHWT